MRLIFNASRSASVYFPHQLIANHACCGSCRAGANPLASLGKGCVPIAPTHVQGNLPLPLRPATGTMGPMSDLPAAAMNVSILSASVLGEGQAITELTRADNNVPRELWDDDSNRTYVLFHGHDGVFYVKADHPESNRIRAVLERSL